MNTTPKKRSLLDKVRSQLSCGGYAKGSDSIAFLLSNRLLAAIAINNANRK